MSLFKVKCNTCNTQSTPVAIPKKVRSTYLKSLKMRVFSYPLRFLSNFFWRYVHFCVTLHPRKKTTAVVKSWSTRLTEKCYILCYRNTLADCQLCENKGGMSVGSQPSPSAHKVKWLNISQLATLKEVWSDKSVTLTT